MKCKSCGHKVLYLLTTEYRDFQIANDKVVTEEPIEIGKATVLWRCAACGYEEDETLNADEWEALKKELGIE